MRRPSLWIAAVIAVSVLPLLAGGIQVRKFIGTFSTDGWVFYQEEGGLFLIESRPGDQTGWRGKMLARWVITSPTLHPADSDQFLVFDREGASDRVRLEVGKGKHAEWNLAVEKRMNPKNAGDGKKEGTASYTFRMNVPEGQHKDWFVGADDPPAETEAAADKGQPRRRRVKLVSDPKQALLFHYVEADYRVHHK